MKIMLADDEYSIKVLLEVIIAEAGYDFCYAPNGEEALNVFTKENPDIIILDVMMPKINGFDVCKKIRKLGSTVPVIILSAKGDIVDKSVGFDAGADDYLVKPFSHAELMMRVNALIRRHTNANSSTLPTDIYTVGDVEICFKRHILKVKDNQIDLTPKEFMILSHMALHPGEVFSKEQLQEYVWGKDYTGEITSIAVFVSRIREKIEENPSKPKRLKTVWGIGYKFSE